MKCKNCPYDITQTMEMIEEAYVTKVTPIRGVVPDSEDVEGKIELITGKSQEDFEYDFELVDYQCSKCFATYSFEELKEIFT
jgi:hypothetical protein